MNQNNNMKAVWKEFLRLKSDILLPAIIIISIVAYAITSIAVFILWMAGIVSGLANIIFAVQPLLWVTVFSIYVCKWFMQWIASNWKQAKNNVRLKK